MWVLEQLLLADCGDEFLEVERFEVGYVLKAAGIQSLQGRGEHRRGFWPALAEVCVGMFDHVGAFAGAVSDEETWALLKIFGEAVFVDDRRGGFGDLGERFLDSACSLARNDSQNGRDDGQNGRDDGRRLSFRANEVSREIFSIII